LRKVSQKLSLPSRDSGSGRSQIQLNPAKLTPSPEQYLGQLAVLTSVIAEQLDHQSEHATDAKLGKSLHTLSNVYYQRHAELVGLLAKLGVDVSTLESKYGQRIFMLLERTRGSDGIEDLMRNYLVFGMLEDSYRKLAKGLAPARRLKVEELLADKSLSELMFKTLYSAIEQDAPLGHRLALYGRMVVADTLLEIRDSVDLHKVLTLLPGLTPAETTRGQFKVLEPYTSELIAEHTVRMDRLGLTA
jgi:hypothetical protein